MSGLIIAWAAILLEGLLLSRAALSRVISKYSFFCAFVAGKLIVDVSALYVYSYAGLPNLYRSVYWGGEFLTLVLACGIILEIFRHVLAAYPGVKRLAKITGICAFTIIVCYSGVLPLLGRSASISGTMSELERNVRSVQAIFLVAVLALISYYEIPITRAMKGMMAGYGLSIATSLVSLATYSYASGKFSEMSRIPLQLGYTVPLAIWAATLWSDAPNPADVPAARIEEDYEHLAQRTQAAVGTLRGYLGRAVRP